MFQWFNVCLHFFNIIEASNTFFCKIIVFSLGPLLSFQLSGCQFNCSQISLDDILKFPFSLYDILLSDICLSFKEVFYRHYNTTFSKEILAKKSL